MTDTPTDRSADRDPGDVSRFIEHFAAHLAEAGFQRMAARLFTALLAQDGGRLTAAELAAILGASPAAISGAVRYLIQLGLVTRLREPGTRRDLYLVQDDTWRASIVRGDQQVVRLQDALTDGMRILGEDSPAGRRLAETRDFFDFVHEEMSGLMERWEKRRAERSAT